MPLGVYQLNANLSCAWEEWVAESKNGELTHPGVQ